MLMDDFPETSLTEQIFAKIKAKATQQVIPLN